MKIADALISKIDLSKYTRVLLNEPINTNRQIFPTPVIRIPFANLPIPQPVTESDNER